MPPWFDRPPRDVSCFVGQNPILSAELSSAAHYHWNFNGTNVPGGIWTDLHGSDFVGASLILTNVTIAQAGIYSVVISNEFGSQTSSGPMLSVYERVLPLLSSPTRSTNNTFRFEVQTLPDGHTYIYASTNLIDWITLAHSADVKSFTVQDPQSTNFVQRYYRSVLFHTRGQLHPPKGLGSREKRS